MPVRRKRRWAFGDSGPMWYNQHIAIAQWIDRATATQPDLWIWREQAAVRCQPGLHDL
jgi:hypothetical protein